MATKKEEVKKVDRLAHGFDPLGPVLMWKQHGIKKPCDISDEIDHEAITEFERRFRPFYNNEMLFCKVKGKTFLDTPAVLDIEAANLENVLNLNPHAYIESYDWQTGEGDLKDVVIPKTANLCVWMFAVAGFRIFGRTWDQYKKFIHWFEHEFCIPKLAKLRVGVHNFGYEFSFMHRIFDLQNVFSLKSQKPVRASDGFIEYFDTLALSGCSLAMLDLTKHKVDKLKGDWDYDKIRHHRTPLTGRELGYCDNDVKKPSAWLAEKMENTGHNIATLPMTATGFVREDLLNRMRKDRKAFDYVHNLKLTWNDYRLAKEAFRGGDTEAGCKWANKKIEGKLVAAYDIGSAHPFQIISQKFPMGRFKKYEPTSWEDLLHHCEEFACLFEVEIAGLEDKVGYTHWLSESTCLECYGAEVINGRVVHASYVKLALNEVQFKILRMNYTWSDGGFRIVPKTFRYAKKDYLPKPLVEACLDYFAQKTTLKDIPEDIAMHKYGWDLPTAKFFYQLYKASLNGQYGDYSMDPLRSDWKFWEGEFYDLWKKVSEHKDSYHNTRDNIARIKGFKPERNWLTEDENGHKIHDPKQRDTSEDIRGYNNSAKRYKFYPWGGWVVSYTTLQLVTPIFGLPREELIAQGMPEDMRPGEAVIGLGNDFVYCDTDCDKYISRPEYVYLFKAMNARVTYDLEVAMISLKIPFERACPEGPDGETYQMGLYEFDGLYDGFKTLGAKRYAGFKLGPLPLPKDATDEEKEANKKAYHEALYAALMGNYDPTKFSRELETTVAGCGKYSKKNLDFDIAHYDADEIDWDIDPENPEDPQPINPKPLDRLPQLLKKLHEEHGLDSPLDAFCFGMRIPAEYTGKLTHTNFQVNRRSSPVICAVTDRFGFTETVEIYSGTHLGPQEYVMDENADYQKLLEVSQSEFITY